MKIIIAKTAGFCMGVRRAVEMVLDAPGKHQQPIYTYGPLIHNPQVLELLREKGIHSLDRIPDQGSGTVLIRAHGVPPEAKEKLVDAGFEVIDATCPRVIKVQTIIGRYAQKGYDTIIIGDKDHPEVVGLLGYAGQNGHVVNSLEDLKALPAYDNAIIVAQTTQNSRLLNQIKQWAVTACPHYQVFDTICDSTAKRQAEITGLAGKVDAVIIVGGKESGNTQRLAEIARSSGKPTFHVESDQDLDIEPLRSARLVGLTAGASTPNWIIKRVYRALELLPSVGSAGIRNLAYGIQRALLLTNIYVSIGAGCLCYACAKLQGTASYFPHVMVAMLYVQSMHIMNNLIGTKADRYNDPDRASFYVSYQLFLGLLATIGGGAGLLTAFTMGPTPFITLLFMSVMGLSYNLSIIPAGLTASKYRRLRDIPGSKTILIALAWGVVTAILPALSPSGEVGLNTLLIFLWSTGLVFVRTAFFDILDVQGDRIVGQHTIPILLGEKKTLKLLRWILIGIILLFLVFFALDILPGLAIALTLCPIFLGAVLSAHERGYVHPGYRLEFLVGTIFILSGLITFLVALWVV